MARTARNAQAAASTPAPVVVAAIQSIDDVLLSEVYEATQTQPGYMFVSQDEASSLEVNGYIEVNRNTTDGDGNIAARITAKGTQFLRENSPGLIADAQENKENEVNTATETAAPTEVKQRAPQREKLTVSEIVDFPLGEASKRGGARPEVYPFSKLEVGKSFFVPATEAVPDPVKALASTVASANQRYVEVVEGERTTKKGTVVPNTKPTRQFAIRRLEDGAPFGFPGVKGAQIGRIL